MKAWSFRKSVQFWLVMFLLVLCMTVRAFRDGFKVFARTAFPTID
jgi:hypothetical protein